MEVTLFIDGPAPEGGVPVWVEAPSPDDSDQVWLKANVLAQSGPLVTARMETSNQVKQLDLRNTVVEFANPTKSNRTPEDVTSLHFINESSILETLQLRATTHNKPYTSIGSVLIAINPLQKVEDPPGVLGTPKASEQPHPYAIAESAFSQMSFASDTRRTNKSVEEIANQSIVSGGESGAGKTESCKMVLRHLVARTQQFTIKSSGGNKTSIDARLLGSNPITEAFGNASTKRNENSSRFGKLLRLHFAQDFSLGTTGAAHWGIRGASVLLMGLQGAQKQELLGATKQWRYLQALPGPEAKALKDSKDETRPGDAKDFAELLQSFDSLQFSSTEVEAILRVVCGILHLGNVEFDEDESSVEGEIALVSLPTQMHLESAAKLLGLEVDGLLSVLVERRIDVRGEVTMVRRNPAGASFARDAVAKATYSSLFDHLIRRIDRALDDDGQINVASLPFIGVLDIFGFESFVRNGFEQLLINFANEALQATFNRSVFIAEADLYKAEGLVLGEMDPPPDNTKCMELLVGLDKKLGVLQTIDAQAQVPQANDANMCSTLHRDFATHGDFVKPHPKDRSSQFIIRHYAGAVSYTVQSFVEKNNDKLPNEVGALFQSSKTVLCQGLFTTDEADKKKARSVVAKFSANIKDLIATLETTKVSFIRCVKPNAEMKRASGNNTWFNRKYVSMQLRCLSVPQTANVLRSGLPTRIPYSMIAEQYKKALPEDALQIWKRRGQGSEKLFTAALFWAFEINPDIFRLGFTKVFFKSGQLAQLDHLMQASANWKPEDKLRVGKRFKLYYIRVMWRSAARKIVCQNRFLRLYQKAQRKTKAVTTLQSFFRMVPLRKRFLKHYAAQIAARKKAKEGADAERLAKEKQEKLRLQEEQREREMQLAVEQERVALEKALERAKELARMEEEQRIKAKREEEQRAAERVLAGAEEKRQEAEKLHRQALAAKILAEAAIAEQRQFELELKRGREMNLEERAKALDSYEREYAMQMAKYEARRKYYGNLQQMAKQELVNYQHKMEDFYNSDQVQLALSQAKQYVNTIKSWAQARFVNLSTPEGRQLEAQSALEQYKIATEQARVKALRARVLLLEQLHDNPWYTRALEQKDKLRAMANSSTGIKLRTESSNRNLNGNKLVVDKREWAQPVQAASNQTERLRALLDGGLITPDEYASLIGALVDQVERKHDNEDVHQIKRQSVMGIQLTCPQCGEPANSALSKCQKCHHSLLPVTSAVYQFAEQDQWSVPVHGANGMPFRARVCGTETVLDPNTYVEVKLFVVELCNGDGNGEDSVFWKVAHPFTDFIHLHQELLEAKATFLTKEAKDMLPDFPQAKTHVAASNRRRSSGAALLAMFGRKKKSEVVVGAGVSLSGLGVKPSNSLLKSGEEFLKQWIQGVFAAAEQYPAKEDKHGENMLLRFKPMDVFLHFEENTK
ncbi:hypothetical protein BASA81_001689 [Batrachochytrium salamandrivorans]|nr:hypothetical protein BASA81_001689 [Batrachochytrium salamandrivorans]